MLAADLHVHTACSSDGESQVDTVIAAARAAGLDAIAITDHDTHDGCLIAAGLNLGILIIPGIEVTTRQGHLLVLGASGPVSSGLDVLETIRLVRSLGGVSILPHPFHRYRHGVALKSPAALAEVDAIEVFNSRYILGGANRKALRWAQKLGKPMVAGSDAHNARYIGYGRTIIDAELTVESILDAIRAGKTCPKGRRTPVRTYTKQSLRNSWRKFKRQIGR
ncbi:MAG TPA: PHP domain-containing protein [Methanospirillum sp.]|nr:PHP domain-containing protein [Methanospirillum sp.]